MGWHENMPVDQKIACICGMVPGMGKFLLNFTYNASTAETMIVMLKATTTAMLCAFFSMLGKDIYDALFKGKLKKVLKKYSFKKTPPKL